MTLFTLFKLALSASVIAFAHSLTISTRPGVTVIADRAAYPA